MKNKKSLPEYLQIVLSFISKYSKFSWILVFIFVAVLYLLLILNINTDIGVPASQPPLTAQSVKAQNSQTLVINQTVLAKLEKLNNTSVSVQALFNQSRNNPF